MADEQRVMNRWIVVLGALVIQISLGAVYIWSVFETPLKGAFQGWQNWQVTLPSQVVLAAFAVATIVGGRVQDRLGPRVIATAGGIVLGVGLILARFMEGMAPGTALVWLVLSFSVLGGIGIGIAYVCPIATCVKWFPDKRGLITGLAVAGFGAGAFFFAPLAKALITGGAYQLFTFKLFALPKLGVFNTFLTLGIIFLIAVVAGAQLLRNPPAGYVPAGWTPPAPAAGAPVKTGFAPGEMLSTPAFWVLWLTYFAGCTAGLQVIMKASPIWQSFGLEGSTPPVPAETFQQVATAATMGVAILAIFNSVGRILWGKISDSLGRKNTLVAMFAICGVTMLLLNGLRSYPLFLAGISVIGLCFGGYLALYPAITADFYGTKHYGVNYGWMFTAYGAGGLFGPFLAAWLMKTVTELKYQEAGAAGQVVEKVFKVGDYSTAFTVAGVACLAAGALVLAAMRPPRAKAAA
jgi:OFA family oxalate/formate antiporter-like MFS transporter